MKKKWKKILDVKGLTMIFFLLKGSQFPSFTVHYTTDIHIRCVPNIEVTVNTCTCTKIVYNNNNKELDKYSAGGQGFMAIVNKPRPQACACCALWIWSLNGLNPIVMQSLE